MDAGVFVTVFAGDKIDSHSIVLQCDRFPRWLTRIGFEFVGGESAGEGGVHFDRLRFRRAFPAPTKDGLLAGREMRDELAGQRVRAGDDKELGILLGVVTAAGIPNPHCQWDKLTGERDRPFAGDLLDHQLVWKMGNN